MPSVRELSKCRFCGELISWTCTESASTKRWKPHNPDSTDHRTTCQGMSPQIRAAVKATSHEHQVRKFLADAKKQKKKRTKSDECKFCRSTIKWIEKTPFNVDGTRHAAGCTGRPSGQVKSVMESMIEDARRAASESLSNRT